MWAGRTMVLLLSCLVHNCSSWNLPPTLGSGRRDAVRIAAAITILPISAALADEAPRVLTDEEMAARVARKQALLAAQNGRSASSSASSSAGLDSNIRSDVNPEAGVNLRSRSFVDNAKVALAKQNELKKRDQKQKREDLCEMLGRGC